MLGWNRFLAQTYLTELLCPRCLPTASALPVVADKPAYNLKINYPVSYIINIGMYFVGYLYIVSERWYVVKHITLSPAC